MKRLLWWALVRWRSRGEPYHLQKFIQPVGDKYVTGWMEKTPAGNITLHWNDAIVGPMFGWPESLRKYLRDNRILLLEPGDM